VGDVGEVDLGGQVMPQGRSQALILGERSTRECPLALERRFGALPEQNVQAAVPDLKDDGQDLMGELRLLALPGPRGLWLVV
jgi:hypothetical protein